MRLFDVEFDVDFSIEFDVEFDVEFDIETAFDSYVSFEEFNFSAMARTSRVIAAGASCLMSEFSHFRILAAHMRWY